MRLLSWALIYACLLLTSLAGLSAGAEKYEKFSKEDILKLPVTPDSKTKLVVTLFTPDRPGPHPLAIINHGSSSKQKDNEERQRLRLLGLYFLSRGYAVAVPMMRGYGGSEGRWIGVGCNLLENGSLNAHDIVSVLAQLRARSDLDTSKTIIAGQSYGGWNSLSVGLINPPQVKGLVNLVGGTGNGPCPSWQTKLVQAAADLGKTTKIPSLWFYGDNDSIIPPTVWKSMFQAYHKSHPPSFDTLVAFGAFLDDAHFLQNYPEGMDILFPPLDQFLQRIGLPNAVVLPDILPIRFPPASGYAAITDEKAVPFFNGQATLFYQKYLALKPPKALIIASDGFGVISHGGFDPIGVGLNLCNNKPRRCFIYAVDDRVVFKIPE